MSPQEAHQEAIRRIAECRAAGGGLLDLGDLPLEELPEQLGRLTSLRVLALGKMAARPAPEGVAWTFEVARPNQRFCKLAVLEGLTGLELLNLSGCPALVDVGTLPQLTSLQSLDLSDCAALADVSRLPQLPGLLSLDLSRCPALADIRPLAQLTGLQVLDLGRSTTLADIRPLARLTGLQSLDLSGCPALADIRPLAELTGLRHLKLWRSSLTDVSPLAPLTGLQSLDLGSCPALADVRPLAQLAALQSLDLSSCTALADVRPLAQLASLRQLKLWGTALADVRPLAQLTGLEALELGGCPVLADVRPLAQLTGLRSLDLSSCPALTDVRPLAQLTGLRSLNLGRCPGLKDVRPLTHLRGLRKLKLYGTGLADVRPLAQLPGLQHLELSYCNALTDARPLAQLAGLQSLHLRGCPALRRFDKLRDLLPHLKELYLDGSHFDDLPAEVYEAADWDNVIDHVRPHFLDLDRGGTEDAELKLFVLGNGGVGKTQLCRRLCGQPFDPSISTTHGVQLGHFSLTLEGRSASVQLRYWDFGGQDVYHGTHALFLQRHAVFLVLWTPHTEHGDADENGVPIRHRPLAYWLDYLRSLAGTDSPILLVQSQCDQPAQRRAPPQAATADFPSLKSLEFSARTDLGLDLLFAHVKEGVRNLLAARPLQQVGVGRLQVRDRLRALLEADQQRPPAERRHRTLTRAEYRALCDETGKVSDPDALLEYLHRCGVVFCRPGLFEDRIILDQAWALEAIYTLFHRQRTLPYLHRDGRFTQRTLADLVWQDYAPEEQATFLGMMCSCGICFRGRDLADDPRRTEWEYVAPDLLPEWSEVQDQLLGRLQDREPGATATVRYRFLHEGILRTFLSRLGEQARDAAVYWKYGCWFWEQTTRSAFLCRSSRAAPGEPSGAGEVTLSAWGDGAAKLVDNVLAILERIPAGHAPEVTRTPAHRERPDMEGSPREAGPLVAAPRPALPETATKQVFLSYAWGDNDSPAGRQRGEVVEGLCARLRAWGYDVVRDKDARQRGDLISDFMRLIGRGDRLCVILSEKYLRSGFCMNELHAVFEHSRRDRDDFLRRVVALSLADAKISTPRERAAHARHWKEEKDALQRDVTDGLLGSSDYALWQKMSRWVGDVSEMLAYLADRLHPMSFEEIVGDDFNAVKELL